MINIWSGACGLCWMVANQFWVSNTFNFARIAFWNKGKTTSFLGRLGSDTYARLGRQICIVVLTTMQRSRFLVLYLEMKTKFHGVS
jgi:hypothetical protein